MVDQALHMVGRWLEFLIGLLFGVFGVIEGALLAFLRQIGLPEGMTQAVLLVMAVLLVIAILRLFGGVLRVLLIVSLILLLLHSLAPILLG